MSDGTVLPYTQSNGYMTALTPNADGGHWLTEDAGGVLHNPDGGVAGFRLRVGDDGTISTIGNVAVGRVGSDGIHLQVDALQGLLGGSPPLVSPTLENRGDSNPAQPTGSVTAGGVSGGSRPPNLAPAGADQEAALDAAKESMDIPLDEVPEIRSNTKDGTVKAVKGSEILRYFDTLIKTERSLTYVMTMPVNTILTTHLKIGVRISTHLTRGTSIMKVQVHHLAHLESR